MYSWINCKMLFIFFRYGYYKEETGEGEFSPKREHVSCIMFISNIILIHTLRSSFAWQFPKILKVSSCALFHGTYYDGFAQRVKDEPF